jgi:transposase
VKFAHASGRSSTLESPSLHSARTLVPLAHDVIEPLLPTDRRGPKPQNNRRVLNGIFWVLRTGAPWRDLPERYGPYTTPTIASTTP